MRTLPINKIKNGYNYTLIKRNEHVAMYEQDLGWGFLAWEVFKIKIQKERLFGDKVFPAQEKFPTNEAFGYSAWTYRDINRAKERFNQLTSEAKCSNRDTVLKISALNTI